MDCVESLTIHKEVDEHGDKHLIERIICPKCSTIIAEYHIDCCEKGMSGWGISHHSC